MERQYLTVFAVAVLAAAAGYFSFELFWRSGATTAASTTAVDLQGRELVGQRRPDYTLGSASGDRVSASDFDGGVVLVNFWATWCKPCREEMPMLNALRRRRGGEGLEVVGIALDDVAQVREFIDELGISYPILVGATDVMATIRLYGNSAGALPYSVLVDREGVIRWTLMGVLKKPELEARIEPLLEGSLESKLP